MERSWWCAKSWILGLWARLSEAWVPVVGRLAVLEVAGERLYCYVTINTKLKPP